MIGETGNDGAPGSNGAKGEMGTRGLPGGRGEAGNVGVEGHAGHDGADGKKGPPGPRGKDGIPGSPGIAGPKGPRGSAGDSGPVGRSGMAGPAGPPGEPGSTGPPGSVGQLLRISVQTSDSKGPNRYYMGVKDRDADAEENIPQDVLVKADHISEHFVPRNGSRGTPSRSCRDIKLEYPDFPNGKYWVDPDAGSIQNAILVQCNFDKNETCVQADNAMTEKHNHLGQTGWLEDVQEDFKYADEIQMDFLRLLSNSVRQRITYHCRNSVALHKGKSINMRGENGVEINMMSHRSYRPTMIEDGCKIKNNKWYKSVFQLSTQQKQRLPIIDVAPFDIGSNGKEFQIEAGPVCFVW
ncbi:hypothetical protein [Salmonella sp. s51933]|uniref:hypothetical protein n=1 Tax=unclassified Salmonella TaxID=2614656 RepID=UPI00375521E1